MNENQNQDYTKLGGWLLALYWCLIAGGILMLLSMVLPALLSIAASFVVGIVFAIGTLVSVVAVCISAALSIKAATQLKARNTQFFDTLLLGTFVSVGGSIASSLLMIRSAYGIGRFIGSTISSIIGMAIGLCICIMYFSKSVRVKTYFNCWPVHNSQYWNWIKILPEFIISDIMPDPSKIPQMGTPSQQSSQSAQDVQNTTASSDIQQVNTPEVNTSEVNAQEVNAPEVNTPEVNVPEENVPEE